MLFVLSVFQEFHQNSEMAAIELRHGVAIVAELCRAEDRSQEHPLAASGVDLMRAIDTAVGVVGGRESLCVSGFTPKTTKSR